MKRIRKALCWLLCAVMLSGAVACSGEKSASGQKVTAAEMQQEKLAVSNGKDREKLSSAANCAPDKVVVENNALGALVQGGKLAAQGCSKVAACRNALVEKGLGALLGIGAASTVLDKLSASDQQYVLGVAMSGGRADDVAQLTPEQRAAYDYIVAQDKQGYFQLLPAQQSSLGDKPASTPNIGKDLSDSEKVELGGAGSGTGTPPPPENDDNQKNSKPRQDLNQKQESAIKKIDNAINNAIKDHDIMGTLKDMDGNPVPKPNGGYWDHMQEMQNTLRGLRNNADTLKNVNNPEAQAAYGRAIDAIEKIESAIKGYGI